MPAANTVNKVNRFVTVFALPENPVIKMKFCGRQARWQKLMPPRHKATDPYRRPLATILEKFAIGSYLM